MSDKGFRGSRSSVGKDIAATLALTAALGMGGGAAAYALTGSVPTAEEVAVSVQQQQAQVEISDPADLLTQEDEARLLRDVERLNRPDTVEKIHFIMLDEGRDNVNDSVENFLRDNYPDEIGDEYFADGVLIIGADMNSRQNFIFAGQDVLDQLYLHKGQRLSSALEAMKPGLSDNNIEAGLFAGANTATDIEAAQAYPINDAEGDKTAAGIASGLVLGGTTLAYGGVATERRKKRRKEIEQAREDYNAIAAEYTQLSQRLDELDIRANSVSSSFANLELRKQWEEVRDRFLGMHEAASLGVGTDRQAWENRKELAAAAKTLEDTGHAEDNINRLFAVEQGDAAERRSIITEIRADVIQARRKVKDKELKRDLAELERGLDYLDQNPDYPGFLNQFTRILGDYSVLLDEVKRREMSDVKDRATLHTPQLTDPGFIYVNYTPYVVMNSWHADNVRMEREAQQASSSGSSSVNTSFSSGFSGGGGSSSF
ncbi:DUF5129 domain-containing protein [Corynebacterium sp. CNCTC7651]|uniref:DUF5129 domain-containing protein n=1 Tax=Corynebacterium sp. CNCTC7651 TaxID=2815361 RepID=UPI001F450910|nr:DUF5129 domain-containing protein [Corynebacterium sp. CNCTC7651]UIZ92123.1 DUF5129 domain-containing protein [Corynebacterium sp. CNCTC7651]